MNILYVTNLWTGLYDILFNGVTHARGMPAFVRPLKALIDQGHQVDLVLIHEEEFLPDFHIEVDWLHKEQIVGCQAWPSSRLQKLFCARRLYNLVNRVLQQKTYDFVYGHGTSADAARKAAQKHGIPYGHRLYGTFFNDYIQKQGLLKAKWLHRNEYRVFRAPKQFLLITNDGSKGDLACEKVNRGHNPYTLHFWLNGVDPMPAMSLEQLAQCRDALGAPDGPFLFYVARIDRWKGQHKAIEILHKLDEKGIALPLFIAGQIKDSAYYQKLQEQIATYKLEDRVSFLGPISREDINAMCKLATASFSLYEMCNLGNVFHEMLSAGAVIVSLDDGSLDAFITDQENGFLVHSLDEAALDIAGILQDPARAAHIREKAIATSRASMRTWEERVQDEVDLITQQGRQ